jgi:hypothetical protein
MALKFVDVTGDTSWSDITIDDEQIHIQHKEDVTDLVDMNRFLASHNPSELTNKKAGWRWIARIPMTQYILLKQNKTLEDKKAFKRWLNDPDNRAFRIAGGKV